MPTLRDDGSLVFSDEEAQSLQQRARAARITRDEQVRLTLVRGLRATDEQGRRWLLRWALADEQRETGEYLQVSIVVPPDGSPATATSPTDSGPWHDPRPR